MNAARKRKLLRKRRCYASSRVPADLVEAFAESVRKKLYADLNKPSPFARIPYPVDSLTGVTE